MKQGFILLLACIMFSGCATSIPQEALSLPPENLANRQMQTRRFETVNKVAMLNAASGVLQDLGFNLEESEVPLGVLVASKQREAVNNAQLAGAIFLAIFAGSAQAIDKEQKFQVSIVMREVDLQSTSKGSIVRVTFQRIIWNTAGQVTRAEQINDPEIYQDFFERLSKSVFLEAHAI